MAPLIVKACGDVIDCTPTNWDYVFCLCTPVNQADEVCTPPSMGNPSGTDYPDLPQIIGVGSNNNLPGVLGQYSTTATSSGQLPSTGLNTAAWSNTDDALADDLVYATISPGSPSVEVDNFSGSDYIKLIGFGFNVPTDATIVGISVAVKGFITATSTIEGGGGSTQIIPMDVFNAALMLDGTAYYAMDPRGTQGVDGLNYSSVDPYPDGSAGSKRAFTQNATLLSLDISTRLDNGDFISIVGVGASDGLFEGSVSNCVPDDDVAGIDAPMPNNFWVSTLKQTWLPSEVNDPTFGVAISVGQFSRQTTLSGGIIAHGTVVYSFNCAGVAVYYTPGGGGGGGNPPSTSPCPSVVVPTGNPFSSFC